MTPHYSVQARLIERRQGVVVRDETRLDTAAVLEDAVQAGRRRAADGFTVWIYRVEDTGGGPPKYLTVETIKPDDGCGLHHGQRIDAAAERSPPSECE